MDIKPRNPKIVQVEKNDVKINFRDTARQLYIYDIYLYIYIYIYISTIKR